MLTLLSKRNTLRHQIRKLLITFLCVGSVLGAGLVVGSPSASADSGTGGDFVAIAPTQKIVDTSTGLGISATLASASTTAFQVLGQGGVPSSGVSAVSVTLEATAPSLGGYLSLWADGTTKPSTSTLNLTKGKTSDTAAILAVGSDGKVDVYNPSGTVDLRIVVNGYYTSATSGAAPGGYIPTWPTRLVDTRNGTGAPLAQIPAGGSIDVQVDGIAGITNESAVFANLTAASITASGSLYAYASGSASGGQPILDFSTTANRSTGAIVPVGSNGMITLKNGSTTAPIDVVVDIAGYFTTTSSTGGGFTPVQARLLDTRTTTAVAAYGTTDLQIGGSNGIPTLFGAAALNIVAISGSSGGYLTAWPTGATMPATSMDNFQASTVTSSMAVVTPNGTGSVSIYNGSSVSIQVVVDLQGWFAYDDIKPSGTATPSPAGPTVTADPTSTTATATATATTTAYTPCHASYTNYASGDGSIFCEHPCKSTTYWHASRSPHQFIVHREARRTAHYWCASGQNGGIP